MRVKLFLNLRHLEELREEIKRHAKNVGVREKYAGEFFEIDVYKRRGTVKRKGAVKHLAMLLSTRAV